MPNFKKSDSKAKYVDDLRHSEYYDMQKTFDLLYDKSRKNQEIDGLMEIILSRENILLAYRNIKQNTGSKTAGTDGLTIENIGELQQHELVEEIRRRVLGKQGYKPKLIRRVDIPKTSDPSKTRPLGIPSIYDRLVQQCIKQVLEPICEAKFYRHSYGFRPNCSVEHAVSRTNQLLQLTKLQYVVEFDIKGFFDNVNHSKLIKQMWAMGIRDKHLIYVIKQILKCPIKMPDGSVVYPQKGTPQGGIISPLLANIVLNELDWWVSSQWENNPVVEKYPHAPTKAGTPCKSHGYRAMKATNLKEMYIVRYADDFRIFCRNRQDAEKTKIAITKWLSERLKLEISEEKTRVVNARRKYMEFLGFKFRVKPKRNTMVVESHISDKQMKKQKEKLKEQAKRIARPRKNHTSVQETAQYNLMVMGMQNYFRSATMVAWDCKQINRSVMFTLTNRLKTQKSKGLVRKGRPLTETEKKRYGKSRRLRYVEFTGEPIYPVGQIEFKKPIQKQAKVCKYTVEGRALIHDMLRINTSILHELMNQTVSGGSCEYADNRLSLFAAQFGKCFVTGIEFAKASDIHCHHKEPKAKGGTDEYKNLVLVHKCIHALIHATSQKTIEELLEKVNLDKEQLIRLNHLRELVGNKTILAS